MPSPNLRFLDGDSKLAKLFREKDWSHHPLGSPESWPQELKTLIPLLLSSMFPMWIAWGKESIFLYNDAQAEMMGSKHPLALGEKLGVVWADVWTRMSPVVDKVRHGESILVEDIKLSMNRREHNEELYASFSCSPIWNASGEVSGLFCAVTETIKRQRAVERESLYSALMDAPVIIGVHRGEDLVMEFANTLYRKAIGAIDDILEKPLVEATPSVPPEVIARLRSVLHTGVPYQRAELPILLDYDGTGEPYEKIWDVIYQPLRGISGEVESVMTCCFEVTEQVKARKLIQRESHKLDQIFKKSPAAMALWTGQDMVFEMANPGYQAVVQNIDLLGKPFLEALPEFVGQPHVELMRRVLETGEPIVGFDLLSRHRRSADGPVEDRYYDFSYAQITDDEGKHYGVYVHAIDVTDRVLARKNLEESESQHREAQERLTYALDSAKLGAWAIELPSGKTVLSEQARQIFGYESEYRTSGEAIDRFLHPDNREKAKANLEHALTNNIPYHDEILIVRPSGEMRWLDTRGRAIYNEKGEPVLLSGIVMDITEQVEARKVIEESEARAREIANKLPMIVWTARPDGYVDWYNDWWYEYLGMPRGTEWDNPKYQPMHPDDVVRTNEIWAKTRAAGEPFNMEQRFRRGSDGQYRWHLVRALPIFDENGKLKKYIGGNTDIHEEKMLAEQLEKARTAAERANETKTAFLANMSHEIRTPLCAILGFSSLLKESNLDTNERDQYLDTIVRNGNSLTRIIDDILDLAKVEAGKLEVESVPFSIYNLVSDAVDLFKDKTKEKGIYLLLIIEDSVPTKVCSDPTRLRQILVNLIGNAVKFTENGGVRINVRASPINQDKIRIMVSVKDTGIGLTKEQSEKLFTPFTQADNSTTRKFGGTGLGLALSQRLSQALLGEISISECKPEEGCTFTLTFVAETAEEKTKTQAQSSVAKPDTGVLAGLRVLVVDDSADNRFLITRLLTKNGAEVATAGDGDEGSDRALTGSYDVVLMDIQMPIMDGYQAKEVLDRGGYKNPVIALTAHALIEERLKTEAAGFAGHLTKPLVTRELLDTVARVGRLSYQRSPNKDGVLNKIISRTDDLVATNQGFSNELG